MTAEGTSHQHLSKGSPSRQINLPDIQLADKREKTRAGRRCDVGSCV